MSDIEHARLLCRLARENLVALETLERQPAIAPAILGFHAQQAVEKAIKAWLSFLGVPYPRIHHLKNLFDLVEDQDPAGVLPFRALERLTPDAVQFRYDDLDPADVADDFREVIECPAPDLSLATLPEGAWKCQGRAFWELLPALRATHDGLDVAIKDRN